ncbi:NUDIX domain-containing protein [Streptomyces sp. NPDC005078]|uniref:NUDIX hydrolase n=1 Tax=unclassified Streptomyces TaxID=2593676 RepID=UPI0033B34ECF
MPPARSGIRNLTEKYLERHPAEREQLNPLLAALEADAEPTSRAALPGHVTCSAVVIDRARRVLHIVHKASGKLLPPGGHVEDDRTLLAAALREVCEEAGIRPRDLCLIPQFLGAPIDVDVHDIDANPAKGELGHRHFDFRFAFYTTAEQTPPLVLQDEEVSGAQWLPFADVRSPTLRTKLLKAEADGLDGQPEPVNASAVIHDGRGRYLLHLRDQREGIWSPGVFALLGGGRTLDDPCLEATLLRELAEEVPSLELTGLTPYAVEEATSVDGLAVPVQVYSGRWQGDPDTIDLQEGVLLRWFTVDVLDRLGLSPGLGDLIRRHAADHSPAGSPPHGRRPLRHEHRRGPSSTSSVSTSTSRTSTAGPSSVYATPTRHTRETSGTSWPGTLPPVARSVDSRAVLLDVLHRLGREGDCPGRSAARRCRFSTAFSGTVPDGLCLGGRWLAAPSPC